MTSPQERLNTFNIQGPPDFIRQIKELDEVKSRVVKILERYPETRDNDLKLQWFFLMDVLDVDLPVVKGSFFDENAGLMETIRRSRQIIQNELNIYPPTDPEVLKKRRQKAENYRYFFGSRLCKREDYKSWAVVPGGTQP